MKVLVVGATGGSGQAAVNALLAAGHEVTAFSRHAERMQDAPRLRRVNGDVMEPPAIEAALRGHDAVVVTLGITENALKVRLRGSATTPIDVRSRGTRHTIAAMRRQGVRKLVVQTSFGVGETRDLLPWIPRLMFQLLLKPQIADTEVQEREVKASGLDWVLAQPVNLTDALVDDAPFVSTHGETRTMKVSRQQVGRFLAEAVQDAGFVGRTVALSASSS